jgi:uncharacterized membrane protein
MTRSILIKPNCSLTPRTAAWLFASLATVCLGVAGAFASMGLWVVLPFAGAELTLLGVALALSFKAASRHELIRIDADRVIVERGPSRVRRWEFRRPWLRIALERSATRNHPSRLLLQQSHRVCEVGRCLTEQERISLFARLRDILG